jgi:hypothetical protein
VTRSDDHEQAVISLALILRQSGNLGQLCDVGEHEARASVGTQPDAERRPGRAVDGHTKPRFAIPVALLPGAMGRRDNERHSAAYGAGPNVRICR